MSGFGLYSSTKGVPSASRRKSTRAVILAAEEVKSLEGDGLHSCVELRIDFGGADRGCSFVKRMIDQPFRLIAGNPRLPRFDAVETDFRKGKDFNGSSAFQDRGVEFPAFDVGFNQDGFPIFFVEPFLRLIPDREGPERLRQSRCPGSHLAEKVSQ